MTKLIFLGSGSAFTVGADNFQSNVLLVSDRGQKLLLDCGSDIRFSLYAKGMSYLDITDIYISHLHSDHVGGLEYVGISSRFDPRCARPRLYLSKDLVSELWEHTLAGGMRSSEGEINDLETFFEVHPIAPAGHFTWEEITFQVIRVIHINNGHYLMPSYGLFFNLGGTKIWFSSDTQLRLDLNQVCYENADLIFHDCETSKYETPVHAKYSELNTLPLEIKRKMWLYGYQPGPLPDARSDGFRGFVKRGQTFEFAVTPTVREEHP